MKICERCGNEIEENAIICSVCGTVRNRAQTSRQPSTNYGQYPQGNFGEPSSPTQGQASQYIAYTQPQTYQELSREAIVGYNNPAYSYIVQQPLVGNGYVLPVSATEPTNKIDSALVTEIVLSLFGIFGVGWLMAGKTAIGVILLLGSILIYWPIILLGTAITMGFGLICLGPLAIGTIILNIVLLNGVLKRRTLKQPYQKSPKEQ